MELGKYVQRAAMEGHMCVIVDALQVPLLLSCLLFALISRSRLHGSPRVESRMRWSLLQVFPGFLCYEDTSGTARLARGRYFQHR